jgi:molybdate transport system regulatory protein
MSPKLKRAWAFEPRFRITYRDKIALGPGKARLLRLVKDTGSISEAARRMEMSYMRAWTLIRTMNSCFREPVITTKRGGEERGGAELTQMGERLLGLYELLETQAMESTAKTRFALTAFLRNSKRRSGCLCVSIMMASTARMTRTLSRVFAFGIDCIPDAL